MMYYPCRRYTYLVGCVLLVWLLIATTNVQAAWTIGENSLSGSQNIRVLHYLVNGQTHYGQRHWSNRAEQPSYSHFRVEMGRGANWQTMPGTLNTSSSVRLHTGSMNTRERVTSDDEGVTASVGNIPAYATPLWGSSRSRPVRGSLASPNGAPHSPLFQSNNGPATPNLPNNTDLVSLATVNTPIDFSTSGDEMTVFVPPLLEGWDDRPASDAAPSGLIPLPTIRDTQLTTRPNAPLFITPTPSAFAMAAAGVLTMYGFRRRKLMPTA